MMLGEISSVLIVEYCPNLQYLEVKVRGVQDRGSGATYQGLVESIKQKLKNGMKKLAKLKANERSVRFGTDWNEDMAESNINFIVLSWCYPKNESNLT
jgi:hypothetical protein